MLKAIQKRGSQSRSFERHPKNRDIIPYTYFGKRRLSAVDPALLVAEIGLNHCGDVIRALDLIEAAAEAGADAVKFQKRCPRTLLTSGAYNAPYDNNGNSFGATYGEHREALEFDLATYRDLQAYAHKLGIELFASVWDEPSLEMFSLLDPPVFKFPSADLTNEPLLEAAAKTGKPLFVSTGMSDPDEIEGSIALLQDLNASFVLFHCVSLYPTPPHLSKLSTISTFSKRFGVPVGYSGHEMETSVAVAARSLGACVIEKHFTLDRSWKGGDQKISLLPNEFAQMVKDVRTIEQAMVGVRTDVIDGEGSQRKKLAKSIVARRDILAGEIIRPDMLICKSPGDGLPPQQMHLLVGKQIVRDLRADDYVLENDVRDALEAETDDTEKAIG